ncbi:MAG: MFS transporter [Hyphomicrobiaceae bacterium]
MSETQQHSWPRIFGLFAIGVTAAFLVGKVPAALPVLRLELGLTLVEAGLLVSMLSLVAALAGVLIGALAESFGQRRTALGGLVVGAVAGVAGSLAQSPAELLAARALEGIGFFMMSVSLPGLILQLADDRRRQSAMGLWGAYLPFGAGLIVLVGGVAITEIGWRGLWLAISAVLAAMILVLLWAAPAPVRQVTRSRVSLGSIAAAIGTTLTSPGAVMLAVTFGCYSGQYLALTSFVPLILVEQAQWALPSAAAVAAVVMMANAVGNILAGLLLDRGLQRATLVIAAAASMAVGSILVMSEALPVAVRLAGALFFSTFGGMIPGALFAGVRQHAPSAAHVSTVNGLMLQSVAIGQFIGPALATYLVSLGGGNWGWSLYYLLPMAALTALAGVRLGRIERRQKAQADSA